MDGCNEHSTSITHTLDSPDSLSEEPDSELADGSSLAPLEEDFDPPPYPRLPAFPRPPTARRLRPPPDGVKRPLKTNTTILNSVIDLC